MRAGSTIKSRSLTQHNNKIVSPHVTTKLLTEYETQLVFQNFKLYYFGNLSLYSDTKNKTPASFASMQTVIYYLSTYLYL